MMEADEGHEGRTLVGKVNWFLIGCILLVLIDLFLLYHVLMNMFPRARFHDHYDVMDHRKLISRIHFTQTEQSDGALGSREQDEREFPEFYSNLEHMGDIFRPSNPVKAQNTSSSPKTEPKQSSPPSPSRVARTIRGYRLIGLAETADGERACVIEGPKKTTYVLDEGEPLPGTGIRVVKIDASSVVLSGQGFRRTTLNLSRFSSSFRGRATIETH